MKKHDKAGKHPFTVSIRGQLMLFIGGITLFTLLLVWSIITFALEPQYNRTIRAKLDGKAADHLSDDYVETRRGRCAFTGTMVGICAQDMDAHQSHADFACFDYAEQR